KAGCNGTGGSARDTVEPGRPRAHPGRGRRQEDTMTALHARILKAFRNEAPRRSARNRGLTPAWVAASVMMLLGAATASARSAEDYYHAAAHQYVAGKIQEASVEAEEGLRLYPGDAKLRMLTAHLRDMKDQ